MLLARLDYKFCGFCLRCALVSSFRLLYSGGTPLPRHEAALRRGWHDEERRPDKSHVVCAWKWTVPKPSLEMSTALTDTLTDPEPELSG